MSDAEVDTTALVTAQFFGGNHRPSQQYLKEHGWMPKMLDKSRFSNDKPSIENICPTHAR
ncbi:MAG: hypothetical protein KME43_18450 [Myxacorys chilensis ATA2-1-KO14]|jgi:hypothetical protein|nr:hypothetical protein [Myxacorys chilensis ATA2-1-KO14]